MFVDSSLASRIDRAEGRMCAEAAQARRSAHVGDKSLVTDLAGGVAVFLAPGSPLNKVIGIGFDQIVDENQLAKVERSWLERGEPVRIELSVLSDPAVAQMLSERGYKLHGFENVLGMALRQLMAPPTAAISVDIANSDAEVRAWLDICVAAFTDMDGTGRVADNYQHEQVVQALLDVTGASGFRRYLAWVDGKPVGAASARFDGPLLQVAGAGTLPAFRGRGVQKALLHRRLLDACEAGCDLAVVTTSPGTRSQENVMRRGFSLLYTRAILLK